MICCIVYQTHLCSLTLLNPKRLMDKRREGKKDCIRLDTYIKVKTFQDNANIELFFEVQPETAAKTSIYLLWNCMARALTMFECY